MNWEHTHLGKISTIIMGQSPPGSTYNDTGHGLPFFQGVRDFGTKYPSRRVYCSDPTRIAEKGDVLFSVRAPIGKINRANRKCAVGRGLSIIRTDSDIDNSFIEFLLRSMHRSWSMYESQGVIFGNMRRHDLERLKIVWPPAHVRSRIASILSAYDDLIENNRRRIELLEKAAKLIYQEWFIRLRFPGHENTKIIDGVPAGWNLTHLSEIFSTQYGYTETASDKPVGPKFLRGTDINKTSFIDWSTVPFCPEDKLDFDRYSLQVGDIVVIRMADPGKVAIVETAQKAIFASYLVRLKQKPEVGIPPLYLFYALAGGDYPGFISRASGGTTRKSANARLLLSFEILLPPENLAAAFVKTVYPMRQQIQTLLRQNGALRQARDSLLPRLISGEYSAPFERLMQ